jgi:hypothetical protein
MRWLLFTLAARLLDAPFVHPPCQHCCWSKFLADALLDRQWVCLWSWMYFSRVPVWAATLESATGGTTTRPHRFS